MGLITETNEQYYAGQQAMVATGTSSPNEVMPAWTGDTTLISASSTGNTNFQVLLNNVVLTPTTDYTMSNNVVTMATATVAGDVVVIKLLEQSIWDNYGSYAYITLTDIVNNFMVAYVGIDKVIPRVKRSDVIFHAKRGLQEFSYDTLKSVKSQELTVPPSLSLAIPQDYVNYVQLSWIDKAGVKHIIYPANNLTTNPTQPLIQNVDGTPEQGNFGENLESQQSITTDRWHTNDRFNITGQLTNEIFENANVYSWDWWKIAYGERYGLQPEISQKNGWFTINEREGKFSFSSGFNGQLIVLEYISDGLAYDLDSKVPKMAEEALYMHIAYSILANRSNIQEYIVQRFKKDRSAQLRNAKIRLSNIKLDEFTQVMRGKSKWIKH
jgi:hypothetical protein